MPPPTQPSRASGYYYCHCYCYLSPSSSTTTSTNNCTSATTAAAAATTTTTTTTTMTTMSISSSRFHTSNKDKVASNTVAGLCSSLLSQVVVAVAAVAVQSQSQSRSLVILLGRQTLRRSKTARTSLVNDVRPRHAFSHPSVVSRHSFRMSLMSGGWLQASFIQQHGKSQQSYFGVHWQHYASLSSHLCVNCLPLIPIAACFPAALS